MADDFWGGVAKSLGDVVRVAGSVAQTLLPGSLGGLAGAAANAAGGLLDQATGKTGAGSALAPKGTSTPPTHGVTRPAPGGAAVTLGKPPTMGPASGGGSAMAVAAVVGAKLLGLF